MEPLRQDIDFHGLFRKLGHNLEEIRVRALDNVLSKLEHKLICDADLINERHLFIRLLEWFNFNASPKSAEALGLLNRLSQHSPAAAIIQEIGGVDFLTQFRGNASPGLQPILDQILEHVMRLPELKPQSHAPECIYHKPADTGMSQTATTIDDSVRTAQLSATPRSFGQVSMTTSLPSAEKLGYYSDPAGYFSNAPEEDIGPALTQYEPGGSAGLRVTVFPWLPLTPTDRHVLQSTNSPLRSKDVAMLTSACEFLSEIVLQDFPAEIFLQRPHVLKSLWSILSIRSEDKPELVVSVARTMTDLTLSLHTRLVYYQDPVLYTPKHDFSSSSSSTFSPANNSSDQSSSSSTTRPSVVGWTTPRHRGDGRDGDSSNSSTRSVSGASSLGLEPDTGQFHEETDADDSHVLQYHQITLPQFCVITLQRALPLLHTQNEAVVVEVMQLLYAVLDLLLQVVTQHVWMESAQPSREICEKLTDSLECVGELLSYHHHSHHHKPDGEHGDLAQHRITYVSIHNYLVRLLQLVPLDSASTLLPDHLISALTVSVFDESLALAYPNTHAAILRLVQHMDAGLHKIYQEAGSVSKSMAQTCTFLTAFKQGTASSEELSKYVEAALPAFPYHCHLPLITDFIKFFSNICYKSTTEKSTISRCHTCLLHFLSYPVTSVRQHTYDTVLKTVQNSLNVQQAADPKSRTCLRIRFLLHHDILYQIICFGLADADTQVSKIATELTLALLQGQLLMTETLWQELTTALTRSQSILQSYADSTTVLGRRIKTMLDPTSKADNLPLIEKFRGTLRYMFSADAKLRAESLRQLAWFLSNEANGENKIPTFSELDVSSLSNIFIMESPRSIDADPGRSVFQVGDLQQVYGIFTSKPVDPGVKKSAADQLAIMLQDQNLHTAFRQEGGLESVLEMLRTGVEKQPHVDAENAKIPYLPACASMLRHLLHHDYTLRHNLAHDTQIYYSLIRVALLYQKDEKVNYEVAHIFTLLLHDEIAKFDVSTSKGSKLGMAFTLPAVVTKRYRLPFRPAVHHAESPHTPVIPPDDDPLLSGPPFEKLKVAWNVAWNGGVEGLLSLSKAGKQPLETDEQFWSKLHLSPVEKRVLEVTDFKWGFKQGVFSISNATSHSSVERALLSLACYLINVTHIHSLSLIPSNDWYTVLGRFLQVMPTSSPDENLLLEVLRFIRLTLKTTNHLSEDILPWLSDKLFDVTGPLIGLLNKPASDGDDSGDGSLTVKRSLDKQLLQFIATFNSRLPYQLCVSLRMHQMRGDLAKKLLLRLNVTDVPQFYNLASLEGTLHCLMHITARPGWSQECTDVDSSSICTQVLNCLLEVVSAFHVGRGSTSMSYMGKGVTKSATLCLRHLAHEMATVLDDKDWSRRWIYSRRTPDSAGEPGLNWMLTLWAYRDPEVRAAGLGIAVALTSTEMGRIIITANCKHIPGGIWGAAFSILLDQSECSMVRQQAALLLVNLTSQTMPSEGIDNIQTTWQGPVVTDPEYEVSLVGVTALMALLHHSHFYQDMLVLLSSLYSVSTVQPVSVTMDTQLMSTGSTETTLSTSASTRQLGVSEDSQMFHSSRRSRHTPITSASSGTPRSGYDGGEVSSNSTETGDSVEYGSVVTSCLVSAVCNLLKNLVILAPQDTFMALKKDNYIPLLTSMIDSSQIQEYCQEMSKGGNPAQTELAFRDLVQMYDSVVSLLRTCALYDSPIRVEILANTDALESIVSLLLIECQGSGDLMVDCHKLWTSVFNFFTSLIQLQSSSALDVLTQAMSKAWMHLSETFAKIVEMLCQETQLVSLSCLHFLAHVCCEEGRISARHPDTGSRSQSLSHLLDVHIGRPSEEEDKSPRTTGSSLCKALISTYELVTVRHTDRPHSCERMAVINTLKSLLVISHSAKHTALDMGLAESLIQHLKQIHGKLNLHSLQLNKTAGSKKDNPLVQELILVFSLLRNFMANNEKVKLACHHSGLANLLHRLWAWAQVETQLMAAMLALILTFTAHCPAATASLAYTSSSAIPNTSVEGKACLSNSSLVHSLIKLATHTADREVARTVFSILATLTLSSECRNILWKSNFFSEFSKLNPQKLQKSKKKKKSALDLQWLELLTNLSFSTEGHQIILKIPGSVDLLLEYMDVAGSQCQEHALLILRNLCCHAANKQKLLSNDKLIPAILSQVKDGGDKLQAMAASALWALIFNNQKAKVVMKNANILRQLRESHENLSNLAARSDFQTRCAEDLKSLITVVQD